MKKKPSPEIEVQITPMLDMAFQLLTFFILTYHPAPTEGQFAMNLMPASPASDPKAATADPSSGSSDLPAPLRTVTTTLYADEAGQLGRVTVGEGEVQGKTRDERMAALKAQLKEVVGDQSLFDQALIQVDPKLRYEELVHVIDAFTSLNVTKVSFADLSESGGTR